MANPRAMFEQSLAAFAQPGNRWGGASALTYWAAACGMTAEEVIEAAHGVGVSSRDTDIRRGMISAAAKVSTNAARFTGTPSARRFTPTRATPKPKQPTDRVRRLIELGRDVASMDALRELSPAEIYPGTNETARRIQGETALQLLFASSDVIHIRQDKADNTAAAPSRNLRPMRDWLFDNNAFGEIVRPNPFTGKQGKTSEGRPSYAAKECIAAFRHMVFEFDEMPLEDQCRFWAGFIRNAKLPLVSLTFSGAKSIHGVVRVNAPDLETWAKYRAIVIERYAVDEDPRFRLDIQALNPLTGCRLAGTIRKDTGKVQELLFDCGKWFDEPTRTAEPPEDKKPTKETTAQPLAVLCKNCRAVENCKAAFGRFWLERSHNGIGCNHPLRAREDTRGTQPPTTQTQPQTTQGVFEI